LSQPRQIGRVALRVLSVHLRSARQVIVAADDVAGVTKSTRRRSSARSLGTWRIGCLHFGASAHGALAEALIPWKNICRSFVSLSSGSYVRGFARWQSVHSCLREQVRTDVWNFGQAQTILKRLVTAWRKPPDECVGGRPEGGSSGRACSLQFPPFPKIAVMERRRPNPPR